MQAADRLREIHTQSTLRAEAETAALRAEIFTQNRNERLQREKSELARRDADDAHEKAKESSKISFQQETIRKEQDHRYQMERLERTLSSSQNHQFNLSVLSHNESSLFATMQAPQFMRAATNASSSSTTARFTSSSVFDEARARLEQMDEDDRQEE